MKYKKVWFTSDTHFCHDNILKFQDNRNKYKDVTDMNNDMIRIWNKYVKKDDLVYILGDFVWSTGDYEIAKKLNGTKILVIGNHDRDRAKIRSKCGVLEVVDEIKTILCKQPVVMSHYPYRYMGLKGFWHGVKNYFKQIWHDRVFNYHVQKRPRDDGAILLHGHIHSKEENKVRGRMIDVGWDAWQRPVNLVEIEGLIQGIVYGQSNGKIGSIST